MDPSILQANESSLQWLHLLVSRLTEGNLQQVTRSGWTVAATLAHLAFWDQRALVLLQRWKQEGVGPSPIDVEATNATIIPFFEALEPRAATELAVRIAEQVDAELASTSPELIAAIEALGGKFRLNRAEHRREHLDEIEAAIRTEGTITNLPDMV